MRWDNLVEWGSVTLAMIITCVVAVGILIYVFIVIIFRILVYIFVFVILMLIIWWLLQHTGVI